MCLFSSSFEGKEIPQASHLSWSAMSQKSRGTHLSLVEQSSCGAFSDLSFERVLYSPMIDSIIFDLDGVIVDTEPLWDMGQEEFLRRMGCVYDRARIKPMITGTSLLEGIKIMQNVYGFSGDPEKLLDERVQIIRDLFRNEITFIPGFEDFYKNVREKYKIAIGTALDKNLLPIIDQKLGIYKMFNGNVWCIEDVGNLSKPNPAIFLYAAEKIKSDPSSCVVIEDSPRGIDAARNAKMRCIGLATTYDRSKLSAADFIADSYSEINLDKIF